MFSDLIRLCVLLMDWRSLLRILRGKPAYDVLFISTIRSNTDRKRLTGLFNSASDYFYLVRLHLGNILGRIGVLNSSYAEILSLDGRKRARKQAIKLISNAVHAGVKTVLFASSTKRLFSRDELIKQFPNTLFTIGDNGTAMMLQDELLRMFNSNETNFNLKTCKMAILGSYGFIGESMVDFCKTRGYSVIGQGANVKRLSLIKNKYNIEVSETVEGIGKVDIVMACTHLEGSILSSDNVNLIRMKNRKLLVLDMAQPPNLSQEEYIKCQDVVIRLDSADAYSKKLKYVLGYFGYKLTSVPRGVTFGCFSEALVLTAVLLNPNIDELIKQRIIEMNHFEVSLANIEFIRQIYDMSGANFVPQEPRTYSKKIKSLELNLLSDPWSVSEDNLLKRLQDSREKASGLWTADPLNITISEIQKEKEPDIFN